MGARPEGHTLDRIDNSKGYYWANCRWATNYQQANNTRTNVLLTVGGITKTASEWARETGIDAGTIRFRKHRGWSDEKTVTTSVGSVKYSHKRLKSA
jgi:hypothetical protein